MSGRRLVDSAAGPAGRAIIINRAEGLVRVFSKRGIETKHSLERLRTFFTKMSLELFPLIKKDDPEALRVAGDLRVAFASLEKKMKPKKEKNPGGKNPIATENSETSSPLSSLNGSASVSPVDSPAVLVVT